MPNGPLTYFNYAGIEPIGAFIGITVTATDYRERARETETKETRGSVFVVPQVNVIVTSRSINGETRARLSGLVREMRNSLRFVKMAGWTWQGTETLSKFDAELLRKHQYLSAFQLSYQGLVTG